MKLDENQVSSILEHTANWEEQNRVSIDDYNKRVKKRESFFRSFYIFISSKKVVIGTSKIYAIWYKCFILKCCFFKYSSDCETKPTDL